MFPTATYVKRRRQLRKNFETGILLFLGNEESPMNYPANTFSFRQDSTFLYYWGLDYPSLAAILDVDEGKEVVFGNDPTVAEIVWTGSQPSLKEKTSWVGVRESQPLDRLEGYLRGALQQGRKIRFLPPYRAENVLKLEQLLGIHPCAVKEHASIEFVKAVVGQRSIKSREELAQIEAAIDVTGSMQVTAMKMSRPGMYEREVVGVMEGTAVSSGGNLAFPIIFSIHGETLHNHYHGNKMKAGNIVVNDSGAESSLHYAGDITRTFPVGGKFSQVQKEVYAIVLQAQERALSMVAPGVRFKDVHLTAGKVLARGLKELGLMKGDVEDGVRAGAHAMFFQCGLGHMMGLDVHDMEDLGEQFVGYDTRTKRSDQFGLCYLRLAKALEPGYVLTVEPGLYFIPELIDQWKSQKKFRDFINYERLEKFRSFGGMRVEDDVVVTPKGCRILGKKIPKSIDEIEALCAR